MTVRNMKGIKIHYITDPDNFNRVVTLVTRLNGDGTVSCGWAVCRPTEWVTQAVDETAKILIKYKGDAFTKKMGREIAFNRLENERSCITASLRGEKPFVACLKALSRDQGIPALLSKIAAAELDWVQEAAIFDLDTERTTRALSVVE